MRLPQAHSREIPIYIWWSKRTPSLTRLTSTTWGLLLSFVAFLHSFEAFECFFVQLGCIVHLRQLRAIRWFLDVCVFLVGSNCVITGMVYWPSWLAYALPPGTPWLPFALFLLPGHRTHQRCRTGSSCQPERSNIWILYVIVSAMICFKVPAMRIFLLFACFASPGNSCP